MPPRTRGSSPFSQPTISAFFAQPGTSRPRKRVSPPIDLTHDDDAEPRPKRARLPANTRSPPSSPHPHPDAPGSAAAQWRYRSAQEPAPEPPQPPRAAEDEVARRLRREQFKKKLLGENNPFLRRKAGADAVTTAGGLEDESGGRPDDSGEESDSAFRELSEMFSRKPSKGKKVNKKAAAATTAKRSKKVEEIGPSGETYTPLEQQIVVLKKSHPGVLLMVEVGYKFKFFGEDAQVAAKELGIICYPDRNFQVASIPVHRRDVHLKKLLSQGHKVGIVEQIETAALKKASENRNAPFDRKLAHLYTAATYVDNLESVDDLERYSPPPLMCLMEEQRKGGLGPEERVSVGMITICPSTGDVVWDEFEDQHMRIELETRLVHTRPTELLLPDTRLSKPTEKMLSHFTGISTTGDHIRIERFKSAMSYTDAFSFITDFYTNKKLPTSESITSGTLMATIIDLPKLVVVVLAHAIKHLKNFSIADAFLETKYFSRFTTKAHMLLSACTLTNLEIYRNETDHTSKGSLMWILDRTKTKFGARLLKSWVGKPLVDVGLLQDRVDAVEEIISSQSEKLVTLRQLLKNLPDLAKGLCRIQYGKATAQELSTLLSAFNKIAIAFDAVDDPAAVGFKSRVLNDIFFALPKLKQPLAEMLGTISLKQAAAGRMDLMWIDPEKFPEIVESDLCIQSVEAELMNELKSVRRILKKPALAWTSVAGEEVSTLYTRDERFLKQFPAEQYLVEIKKAEKKAVPDSWHIVSRTKNTERYHTPEVRRMLQERAQYQEALAAEARKAFLKFLGEISHKHYGVLRDAVNKLAIADCLLSFAVVALQGEGYVRPQFTADDRLEIVGGRHPMIEALRSDPYVPNSLTMGGGQPRSRIITGPNMGGKSSAVRMIALIAIMAQIGCYVPADSVKLGMLDSIHTRMGASDDLARGRSTFMVEMTETSDILRSATENSLVILDELGRGTSTFDGMSIASGVLQHLVQATKCKTLFITHYPLVATDLEKRFPKDVSNAHMAYTEDTRIDGTRDVVFLYRLTSGIATESFGVECARLAGLPETILSTATRQSSQLRLEVEKRSKRSRYRKCAQLLKQSIDSSGITSLGAMEELRTLFGSTTV